MKLLLSTGLFLFILFQGCKAPEKEEAAGPDRKALADTLETLLLQNLLHPWYPAAIDSVHGGYLSTFDSAFTPVGEQNKMIVSQGRHLWNNSKAALHFPSDRPYKAYGRHGFEFLRDKMWDARYGGFFTFVDRMGNPQAEGSKTAYGNSFAIYGLSAYFLASGDTAALDLAKKAFLWLETHSHDSVDLGYFQHLSRQGERLKRQATTPSTSDLGYKDQNSSIHLLEAFTELYLAWPDPLVKSRLDEMLFLIRDKIVNDKGNLVLFFQPDWTPVSFADSSREGILRHHNLDHLSFGHDIETAYLLMEASHVSGWENDSITWARAKQMTDQCLVYGWDDTVGGFYDEGYNFRDAPGTTIIRDTKTWWAQAEALNTLLIMADLYPDDPLHYYDKFLKQWSYIDRYLIDHKNGDWYDSGLDKNPAAKNRNKGHIWKAVYHQYRSLENCVVRLREGSEH